MTPRSQGIVAAAVAVAILVLDQWLKIWVKTSFYLGEQLELLPWFRLVFIENNGMAFGMELGSKLVLTLFRVTVVGVLCWYVWRLLHWPGHRVRTGYLVVLALIIAGALGNIIDCLFYGLIFNNPAPPAVAQMFPPDGGYAGLMYGRVVDMLYFPLFSFTWPGWVPGVGGERFLFFQPVFNLADSAITVGMFALLIFYSRQLVWPRREAEAGGEAGDTRA